MIIAMAAVAFGGIGPKTHQLRHSRGEAAHDGVTARSCRVFRTAVVVWIVLVPLGLAEVARAATAIARDEPSMLQHRSPFSRHVQRSRGITQRQHTFCYAVQIIG